MIRTILAAGLLLGLAACDRGAPVASEAPAASETTVVETTDTSGLALAEAQLPGMVAVVAQDEDNCQLPEGVERQSRAIDLGGGVGAVIVQCSQGMPDTWYQLFIAEEGGGHPARVPLIQYDIEGDGEWHAETATPNLEWIPSEQVFISSIAERMTGCGTAAKWRYDPEEGRVRLVEQTVQDCDRADGENLPEPRIIWPTSPPTPEPGPV